MPSNPRNIGGIPRWIECLVAALGLLIAAPIIAVCGVAVVLTSRGPMLFRQRRVGRNGTPFTLWKLRTMRPNHSGPQVTSHGDDQIIAVGRFLRKTKLDEVPELWNILRGDMSFVGPRPEVPRYVDLNNVKWQQILAVRPGLTDPVTIQLRNEEEVLARIAGDREQFYLQQLQPVKLDGYLHYLSQRTWVTDLGVIWATVVAVLFPRKHSAESLELYVNPQPAATGIAAEQRSAERAAHSGPGAHPK